MRDRSGRQKTGPPMRLLLVKKNDEAEKEDSMKVTYVAPEIEITVVDDEDVIMISGISGLEIKDSGDLTEVGWSSLA